MTHLHAFIANWLANVFDTRVLPEKVWHFGIEFFCPQTFEIMMEPH